jgi:hypothetical protein
MVTAQKPPPHHSNRNPDHHCEIPGYDDLTQTGRQTVSAAKTLVHSSLRAPLEDFLDVIQNAGNAY